jgi:pyridoxine kinase
MARVLILSSFVAASRVGGGAQALALARLGIEPILAPTVIFGRHPGHGAPGGAAVEAETFEAVLGGIEASGAFEGLAAVVTGHFSSAAQIAAAAEALERVRRASPLAPIVVDPIMGDDDTGLYVREPVAEALAAELIPLADWVCPNAWELDRLTGYPATDPVAAAGAARALGKPTLVSSVAAGGGDIGVVMVSGHVAWLARHVRAPAAPRGTGDLLTAVFAAGLARATAPAEAFEAAVGAVAEAVALAAGAAELPLGAMPTTLAPSPRVAMERVGG